MCRSIDDMKQLWDGCVWKIEKSTLVRSVYFSYKTKLHLSCLRRIIIIGVNAKNLQDNLKMLKNMVFVSNLWLLIDSAFSQHIMVKQNWQKLHVKHVMMSRKMTDVYFKVYNNTNILRASWAWDFWVLHIEIRNQFL